MTDDTGHISDAVFCLDSGLASPLQEYVRKLGACLVEVRADFDGDAPCPSTVQLHTHCDRQHRPHNRCSVLRGIVPMHLLQEYVRKLGACLVEVRADCDGDAPCPSTLQLHTWAAEATSLMVCIALRNPWAIKAFNAAVDTNTAAEEGNEGTTAQHAHSAQLLVCPKQKWF